MGDDPRSPEEKSQRALDAELVPLSVAATVAYYYFADAKLQREDADNLARATGLAAVSLCQVAMIFLGVPGRPPRAMTSDEVHRLLCRPMLDAERRPDLDRFLIRRADLRAALTILRQARDSCP